MRNRNVPVLLPLVSGLLFFIGFEIGGYQLVLRNVSNEFSMTPLGSGLLVAMQNAGFVLAPLLFGTLSDRVGKKRTLFGFMLTFILGCALAAAAGGMWAFIAGVFLIGIGYCMCECIGTAALADAFPEKSAQYINLSQSLLSFGAVVSPILIQWGTEAFSWNWRTVFLICGIGYAMLLPPFFFARFENASGASIQKRMPMRAFFRSAAFSLLFFSVLLYVGLECGIGYFTESLFALKLSSDRLGAYAISAYWLCMAVSRFVCSFSPISPQKTLLIGFGASFVLFSVLAVSGSPYLSLVLCGLIGFAFGPIWSLLVDLAAKEFPQHTGGAIGLMSAGCGLGGMVFPSLMGFLSDRSDIRFAFIMLSATALAACILSYLIYHRMKRGARG
ncbi:MAG TPA: MFS transporter [Feifaniaceae bacterium]|nr:MFS transporter [Feifaniaceae bacterium]